MAVLGASSLQIDSATLDSQSGSAPMFAARAWVNFNGTGTIAIRADGNVSSITDGGQGIYTVVFTTGMPDANYSVACSGRRSSGTLLMNNLLPGGTYSTTAVQVNSASATPANQDSDYFNVAVFT